jgi:hypothetical protein
MNQLAFQQQITLKFLRDSRRTSTHAASCAVQLLCGVTFDDTHQCIHSKLELHVTPAWFAPHMSPAAALSVSVHAVVFMRSLCVCRVVCECSNRLCRHTRFYSSAVLQRKHSSESANSALRYAKLAAAYDGTAKDASVCSATAAL